jgi:hypothetical protein
MVHGGISRKVATFVACAAASGLLILACAPPTARKELVKECILPSEQAATLSGKWGATPIPISFKSGNFDSASISDMVKAADTWNDFYMKSQGHKVLDYGDAANPRQSTTPKPSNPCATGLVSNGEFTGTVVIYNTNPWTSLPNHNPDAIALTSFCTGPGTPLKNMYMAIMEVNTQNFFVTGTKLPDMESIFLHEFGHLLGLDHSCSAATKAGFPNCNDPTMPDDYFFASMFPVVIFDSRGIGEIRRTLQPNDEGRANCLYPAASGT